MMVLREGLSDAGYLDYLWHIEPPDTMLHRDLGEWPAPWTAAADKYVRLCAVDSRPVQQQSNAGLRSADIVFTGSATLANEVPFLSFIEAEDILKIVDVVLVGNKRHAALSRPRSRYVAPLTPVEERIDELILEEHGLEDLLLERRQQAEWLKQALGSHWDIHLPQPFIGFDLDDGLFVASWQSDSECNTLTIDAMAHTGWYDPWPASESDNPMPGEVDLDTEEAWERLRTALTITKP